MSSLWFPLGQVCPRSLVPGQCGGPCLCSPRGAGGDPGPPQRRAPAEVGGKRTDKADLIQKEMQRSDGKAHQRGTVVALSRWRAVLLLGGKRSQATFPENNVWLHGRKQGAKEKDFQPGSIFFSSSPSTPDTCAKKPDFVTSSAKE